ncbi:uncharacterized protein LOC124835094 [Vigna umbellata]|uniref:uncharacterized protein LOC124835094 n=1 Tax=Vigna umbellata TaxID=87088 RepID=UPI001F5E6398|nr:uncharacterized protein LOC124835094 [Vigna umbellata]
MEKVDQINNPASPYYLHPGENPGASLISQVLNESNYTSWSRNMSRALLSKNKLKFIDGGITRPINDDSLFDAWERINMMVLSWITKTLSPQIVESVIYVENAQELWEELKERFSKGDHFKFSDLLQEIHSIKQGERTVNQYFTDLKTLWEELEFLRPIPSCSCKVPCSCDLSKNSHKYRDMEHVICFLKGLNECYSTVKTQILLMEPLPNINRVFSLIIQQARQEKHDLSQSDIKVLANTTERQNQWKNNQGSKAYGRGNPPRNQGRGRGRNPNYGKQCSHCHKMNHTIDECYSKHGYPPWYKRNDSNSENSAGQNEWGSANTCSTSTATQNNPQKCHSKFLSPMSRCRGYYNAGKRLTAHPTVSVKSIRTVPEDTQFGYVLMDHRYRGNRPT